MCKDPLNRNILWKSGTNLLGKPCLIPFVSSLKVTLPTCLLYQTVPNMRNGGFKNPIRADQALFAALLLLWSEDPLLCSFDSESDLKDLHMKIAHIWGSSPSLAARRDYTVAARRRVMRNALGFRSARGNADRQRRGRRVERSSSTKSPS